MVTITKNSYYELEYDEAANIVYWKMNGFWKDMSVVPGFHEDWSEVRQHVKPGWKILSDARNARVIPPEVNEAKVDNQKKALEEGCVKIALLVDSAITKMSLQSGAAESGIGERVKSFSGSQYEEAVRWLKES